MKLLAAMTRWHVREEMLRGLAPGETMRVALLGTQEAMPALIDLLAEVMLTR
jgi:hypothetical protein